jgi:hypothetical protein
MNKLKEIQANIQKLDKEYREIKGYGECCEKPCPAEVEDRMYQMISNVYKYIDYVQSNFYSWQNNHTDSYTHLPKLTPSQTEKLLKAAGADKDFSVEKRVIFASLNRQGNKEFEIDLKTSK